MARNRLTSIGTQHLDRVAAIPRENNHVALFLHVEGAEYRALLNGKVVQGGPELADVASNAAPKKPFVRYEEEVPAPDAKPDELRRYYGNRISARSFETYMYHAEDGKNRGVRPLV